MSESLGIEDWRQKESKELSYLVEKHIKELQTLSPEKCLSKETILCNLTNNNGFASGLHDIIWCLIAGYYSNRTVILLTKHYHYLKDGTNRWTDFFKPLSPTCDESLYEKVTQASEWPGANSGLFI